MISWRQIPLVGLSCLTVLVGFGLVSTGCTRQQPQQDMQSGDESSLAVATEQTVATSPSPKQAEPRTGQASAVASNFYPGMAYAEVINQIGPPDQIMSRKTTYRWEQGENFFAIAYTEEGQFAGSGFIQTSTDHAFSETDHDTFQQLVNRQASYAEFAQAFGDATRTLEEVEYGWLYENNVFLRLGVMEEKITGVGYW
ncbi:MAG: hypothetical protein ACTS2F_25500 [Thainema sp.]